MDPIAPSVVGNEDGGLAVTEKLLVLWGNGGKRLYSS